jgi:hypothetical protein
LVRAIQGEVIRAKTPGETESPADVNVQAQLGME